MIEFLYFCCVSAFAEIQEQALMFAGCAETEWYWMVLFLSFFFFVFLMKDFVKYKFTYMILEFFFVFNLSNLEEA